MARQKSTDTPTVEETSSTPDTPTDSSAEQQIDAPKGRPAKTPPAPPEPIPNSTFADRARARNKRVDQSATRGK